MYGSSRLGIVYPPKDHVIYDTQFGNNWDAPVEQMNVGLKRYEISNHLGNVLASITARPVGVESNATNGIGEFFEPSLANIGDYCSFAILRQAQNRKSEVYPSGFNGQERDDEIAGVGNFNTALYWEYDTRLGRRWNVDPEFNKMPGWSPYSFSLNNPISVSDPDGEFPIYFMVRRYESSGYFGTPFISKGDNRQTSANVLKSARIHHLIGVETNSPKGSNPVFYDNARSSESTQYMPWFGKGTATPNFSASGKVLYNNEGISASNFNFSNSGKEPIASKFCESCTPAIDTKGFIGVNEFKDKVEVQIFGSVNGDNFPDAEGFIYDASGNGISLGDYQHSMYGSPMKDLWGVGNEYLLKFDITVKVDKKGNFQSASFLKDGKATPLKVYSQKETNFKAPEEEKK